MRWKPGSISSVDEDPLATEAEPNHTRVQQLGRVVELAVALLGRHSAWALGRASAVSGLTSYHGTYILYLGEGLIRSRPTCTYTIGIATSRIAIGACSGSGGGAPSTMVPSVFYGQVGNPVFTPPQQL